GLEKSVAPDINNPPVQRFFRRKSDRVQQDVELPPFLFDPLEYLLRLPFDIDIQRHEYRRFQLPGERLDKAFRAIVQIGPSQIGAQGPKCLGTTPGNGLIVGDPYDQAFSSLEVNLRLRRYWNGHDALWINQLLTAHRIPSVSRWLLQPRATGSRPAPSAR